MPSIVALACTLRTTPSENGGSLVMVDAELLKVLACPGCKGPLEHDAGRNTLDCKQCRLLFPVDDGVPIMLVEEAERY